MWRFAHVSDPCFGGTANKRWNNRVLCTALPEIMDCLRRDLAARAPDFLLVTGDLTGEPCIEQFRMARELLDSLAVPYYVVGGVSDFAAIAARGWFLDVFGGILPRLETHYAFRHRGMLFCCLDPWWLWPDGSLCPFAGSPSMHRSWAIPPHQFQWLHEQLEEDPSAPAIIVVHQPPCTLPERFSHSAGKDAGALANGALLTKMLSRYPRVRMILSGYAHVNCIAERQGISHVVTCAVPEYPVEYREIQVHQDRLRILTHGLSDPAFAARSLIPGFEWASGTEQDREAAIPLSPTP